jgi:CRISPR-associated protein Csb2
MLFSLRTPDDQPWSAPGTEAMAVAAMARHAIQTTAQQIGYPVDRITDLMGHGDQSRRLIPIPVPNVGHHHADGRVRRILMTATQSLEPDVWQMLMYRLVGADLAPPGAQTVALLVPAPGDDRLKPAYLNPASCWCTATPLILPGWDTRRGKPRPMRALRRLLAHANIDQDLLQSADFQRAPMLAGALTCAAARLPRHLEDRPRIHLRLRWRQPVPGPIALGAGIGYGYGLLRAA